MNHYSLVPIPTFILGPLSTEHAQFYGNLSSDGGELCNNVTCLGEFGWNSQYKVKYCTCPIGQRGVYKTSSGLTIAYVSGKHDYDAYKTTSDGTHIVSFLSYNIGIRFPLPPKYLLVVCMGI